LEAFTFYLLSFLRFVVSGDMIWTVTTLADVNDLTGTGDRSVNVISET